MKQLIIWKSKENRKPLIIKVTRQTGKTWLMKEFGKTNFEKVAYISFYNNKRMDDVFQEYFNIDRILMSLNIESGITITPNNTLIIFDEIQESKKALESLKYFCEEAKDYAGQLPGNELPGLKRCCTLQHRINLPRYSELNIASLDAMPVAHQLDGRFSSELPNYRGRVCCQLITLK